MFVAILFIPVVAGNIFLESEFHRLPNISERNKPPEKTYMLFDPCYIKKAGKRTTSCALLKRRGNNLTAEYKIGPHIGFSVWCDMETDGGGWTVIQRRSFAEKGDTEFERLENDYDNGFHLSGSWSYWIGTKNIHELTTYPNNKQALRIELTTDTDEKIIVEYREFEVGSKTEHYKLAIGGYWSPNGSKYDALTHHNGGTFEITDENSHWDPCGRSRISGGWWLPTNYCFQSNLNGRKMKKGYTDDTKGFYVTWYKQGDENSYKYNYERVEMKIRDADFGFCVGQMAK